MISVFITIREKKFLYNKERGSVIGFMKTNQIFNIYPSLQKGKNYLLYHTIAMVG